MAETPTPDPVRAIREALDLGPTPGPWIGAGPSFGDKLPRYTTEIVAERDDDEDCETICTMPLSHHDAENEANARLIEACNPAAIAALLAQLEAAQRKAARFDWLEKHFTDVNGVYLDSASTVRHLAVDCEEDSLLPGKARLHEAIDAAMAEQQEGNKPCER